MHLRRNIELGHMYSHETLSNHLICIETSILVLGQRLSKSTRTLIYSCGEVDFWHIRGNEFHFTTSYFSDRNHWKYQFYPFPFSVHHLLHRKYCQYPHHNIMQSISQWIPCMEGCHKQSFLQA